MFELYRGNLLQAALTNAGHAYPVINNINHNPAALVSNPRDNFRDQIKDNSFVKKFDVK